MKRDAKKFIPQSLTANALHSGLVVFRAAGGEWVEDVSRAEVVEDNEAAEKLTQAGLKDEADNKVVGPYLVNVRVEDDGRVVPTVLREAIRAAGGPTAGTSVVLKHKAPDGLMPSEHSAL